MPDCRKIDFSLVQRLRDGAVIPASGRRPALSPPAAPRRGYADRVPGTDQGRTACRPPRSSDPSWSPTHANAVVIPSREATMYSPPVSATIIHAGEAIASLVPASATVIHSREATSSSAPEEPAPDVEARGHGRVASQEHDDGETTPPPLFTKVYAPILQYPPSPPRAVTTRRKTMAGMDITRGDGGFTLRRSSIRIKNRCSTTPIAKMAEKLLCRRMGIINEGDQLTEEAIGKFAALLHGRRPAIAIDALHALFRLDCDLTTAVEDALVAHGGAGATELPPEETAQLNAGYVAAT
ncbi:hypothetical protein D1007_59135 [Hordeum vulgare]|nr:hypothetical protein D1007_59135 [Hordeum vulgare]